MYLLSGFFDYDPGGPVERPPGCTVFRIAGVNSTPLIRAGLPASVPGLQAVPDLFFADCQRSADSPSTDDIDRAPHSQTVSPLPGWHIMHCSTSTPGPDSVVLTNFYYFLTDSLRTIG